MHSNSLLLGINIDHVATLRQVRGTTYPEPLHAAFIAVQAGADSITLHLREDRRHIQEHDVRAVKEHVMVPLNFEMAATKFMCQFALSVQPTYCCIVPEKREELTTEGGLNVAGQIGLLTDVCAELTAAGIQVSFFIDPDCAQIDAVKQCGAPIIELHTGEYAEARDAAVQARELSRLAKAAEYADALGIQVNAGHGLHYHNVAGVVAIPVIRELNIGHSIVARALFVGMAEAVREMRRLCTR